MLRNITQALKWSGLKTKLFTINDSIIFLEIAAIRVTQILKFIIYLHMIDVIAKFEELKHKREDNCTVHSVNFVNCIPFHMHTCCVFKCSLLTFATIHTAFLAFA